MVRFKRSTTFFDESKRKKKAPSKKVGSLIKNLGGRRGVLLSSILLKDPKYKDLI